MRNDVKIKRCDLDWARVYRVEHDGLIEYFPSVTTVLSACMKKDFSQMIANIGEENFKRKAEWGVTRGECMHKFLENFVIAHIQKRDTDSSLLYSQIKSKSELEGKFTPEAIKVGRALFYKIIDGEFLEDVSRFIFSEKFIYSLTGKFAGTMDLVYANKERAIVVGDFKSSSYEKNSEDILSYFFQASAYVTAFEEIYGYKAKYAKIIIASENYQQEQVKNFIISRDECRDYYNEFQKMVKEYFAMNEENFRKLQY